MHPQIAQPREGRVWQQLEETKRLRIRFALESDRQGRISFLFAGPSAKAGPIRSMIDDLVISGIWLLPVLSLADWAPAG